MRPAAVVLLVFLLPLVQGHASPDPLDVEVHVLADDASDQYALYDGHDIQDLYVREADLQGQQGIVLRAYLYGGFAPAKVASQLHADFTVAGQTYRVSTSDGTDWQGELTVLEASFEEDESLPVLQGYLQVMLPYGMMGKEPGQSVEGFELRTYADGDLRDIAPGGRPVPGTNGEVIEDAPSQVLVASLPLVGPQGYTKSSVSKTDATVAVDVQNLITTVGQHISLDVEAPAAWTVTGAVLAESVQPGEHPTFTFDATAPAGSEPLVVHVRTDLGGKETFLVDASGATLPTTSRNAGTLTGTTSTPSNDSPGLAPLLTVALLALFARRPA